MPVTANLGSFQDLLVELQLGHLLKLDLQEDENKVLAFLSPLRKISVPFLLRKGARGCAGLETACESFRMRHAGRETRQNSLRKALASVNADENRADGR